MEVVGYPDYLIYNDGRVWSKVKGNGRFMKTNKNQDGYLQLRLLNRSTGKRNNKMLSRLIAEHYIPNPENKPEVDHINRERTDNRLENLRWVDRTENNKNRGIHKKYSTNKSGHKFIHWNNSRKRWRSFNRYFKSKTDALCYKFIYLLKIK
tara:strand:- start:60 stop:512 length:453 start_codon:yes stop_codon:yes gene_type:complete